MYVILYLIPNRVANGRHRAEWKVYVYVYSVCPALGALRVYSVFPALGAKCSSLHACNPNPQDEEFGVYWYLLQ